LRDLQGLFDLGTEKQIRKTLELAQKQGHASNLFVIHSTGSLLQGLIPGQQTFAAFDDREE
jgi:hypothetical protein